jgi:hypothetical protein
MQEPDTQSQFRWMQYSVPGFLVIVVILIATARATETVSDKSPQFHSARALRTLLVTMMDRKSFAFQAGVLPGKS